jgi:LPXTG-motif cell wall-anchored protein
MVAPAALAQTPVCDAYSKTCVGGVKEGKNPPAVRPSRGGVGLPITGGEFVSMMVVGAGAIAGGTILVAAGRKRRLAS